MSIERCEKHDYHYDTDKQLECPRCENEAGMSDALSDDRHDAPKRFVVLTDEEGYPIAGEVVRASAYDALQQRLAELELRFKMEAECQERSVQELDNPQAQLAGAQARVRELEARIGALVERCEWLKEGIQAYKYKAAFPDDKENANQRIVEWLAAELRKD